MVCAYGQQDLTHLNRWSLQTYGWYTIRISTIKLKVHSGVQDRNLELCKYMSSSIHTRNNNKYTERRHAQTESIKNINMDRKNLTL